MGFVWCCEGIKNSSFFIKKTLFSNKVFLKIKTLKKKKVLKNNKLYIAYPNDMPLQLCERPLHIIPRQGMPSQFDVILHGEERHREDGELKNIAAHANVTKVYQPTAIKTI